MASIKLEFKSDGILSDDKSSRANVFSNNFALSLSESPIKTQLS